MRKYILKAETGHIKLTPCLFFKYAKECFEAGNYIEKKTRFSVVPYYLYCRSIELSLKAFLFNNNFSINKLKTQYGHNLIKLFNEFNNIYNKSFKNKLNILESEKNELKKASCLYDKKNKAFEYVKIIHTVHGYNSFP